MALRCRSGPTYSNESILTTKSLIADNCKEDSSTCACTRHICLEISHLTAV
jgi:hypothetical protein